ncbi:MAG TPA: tRNA (adenosine(37)-N6)-dimethylallyltransferase MiaA, partial [Acidimicrobiales bacterium]|nr:tRNA (adenosine(37)-N6)-dimethylallyltransferase MiaA [Acidimicrobiales bacterium]
LSSPPAPARHLALVGCTASGKSAIAFDVARSLTESGDGPPVELVAVDSMQVYRGMDIGTAKPSPAEQAEIPHHLIDLVDPAEEFTVTRYQTAARAAMAAIESRGHRALLVGGTGLYFQALVDGLTPPGRYPDVRDRLEAEDDTPALHRRLSDLDPVAAARMEPGNRRRVLRALEVTLGSGRPFSSFGPGVATYPPTPFRLAGVWLPRPCVSRRIEVRFDTMMAAGLVDEVRRLATVPNGLSRTARQALGYREVLAHLEGGVPLAAAVDEAVRRTRAFARRQRVWWRRDPRVTWFGAADNPLALVPSLLGDWRQP